MHEHLQDSDLLSGHQWGFCSGQSTMLTLATVTHNWFSVLEEGKEVFAVFFDYKRYLTSTLYLPLSKKLKKLPFHSCIVETGYLTHHLQYVVVNGHSSDLLPVKAGVPQGSQLGPLLFHNLCIFNIDLHQHGIIIPIYANDILLCHTIHSHADYIYLQQSIESTVHWSDEI